MSHLRSEFEKETGKVSDNCTGIGDYSGLQADADINSDYIKWLETKVEKILQSASPTNKHIDDIIKFGCGERDTLGKILSNACNMGSSEGALISGSEFPRLIDDLIVWKNSSKAKTHLPEICPFCKRESLGNFITQ